MCGRVRERKGLVETESFLRSGVAADVARGHPGSHHPSMKTATTPKALAQGYCPWGRSEGMERGRAAAVFD